MAVKVFITGVTGYVGGDVLYLLHERHPELQYTVLVRSREKAAQVSHAYPTVRVVLGGLDDSGLLRDEARNADIVIHCADASDHEGAARAISEGLVTGHSPERPGIWLHTGGVGILTYEDSQSGALGQWSDRQYNDLDGVDELTSFPDDAFHRNVDKIVLETGTVHASVVKTALICPPTIYGKGRGPVSGRSRQAYDLAKFILQKGCAPIIEPGESRFNNIHIFDLTKLYCLLLDAALAGNTNNELWGGRGYFLVEHGEHFWADYSRAMARKAASMGLIPDGSKEQSLTREEAVDWAGFEALSWGQNSRGKAGRAAKYLGWEPVETSFEEEIPRILQEEYERLRQ